MTHTIFSGLPCYRSVQFVPLHRPDIVEADPALTLWETSDSISITAYDNGAHQQPDGSPGRHSTNLLLAESMLRFCDYGAGLPDNIVGTDQTEALRQRFVKLRRHIERALLREARMDEALKQEGRSNIQWDVIWNLVRDWAKQIQAELLESGQRTEHWSCDTLPWILGHLNAWDDIEFSILTESGIISTVGGIISAPTIPIISYMPPIRRLAAELLRRWVLLPETAILDATEKTRLGLAMPVIETPQPANESHSMPRLLYHLNDALAILNSLHDLQRIFVYPISSPPLPRKAPTHIGRTVTGYSYYPVVRSDPTLELTFRDRKALPSSFAPMFQPPPAVSDERIWTDVRVKSSLAEPVDVLFKQFVSTANAQHRHPLAPLHSFSIAATSDPFCSHPDKSPMGLLELQKQLWEISPGRFLQGRLLSGMAPSSSLGSTSPPVIASHIYVPRSFERLGIYPHAAYRKEVSKDTTPVKLEPPITAEQANALLGRAIQYEVPLVPIPPLPPTVRAKKKRRENPPPVYWGVVWGVDTTGARGAVLKIFTGGQYYEACGTLTVGEPCAVPTSPVDTDLPFTPKWVGLVSLVDASEETARCGGGKSPGSTGPRPLVRDPGPRRRVVPQFEVGVDGDCVILAGEIALHGGSGKAGAPPADAAEDPFDIWVRWVREGTIDLAQPVEAFACEREAETDVAWTVVGGVSADGGSMALLARGLTTPEAVFALTGNDEMDVDSFVECIVLHGQEEDSFYIPAGVSSYTGGDGGFDVLTASDAEGRVVETIDCTPFTVRIARTLALLFDRPEPSAGFPYNKDSTTRGRFRPFGAHSNQYLLEEEEEEEDGF
ncbi:hypothetical protein C8J57DRAFT_1663771 [Mycena rebaudengoi]|nr:hypothetical protein C8J57DRAFT_1663771 [Mycena rebaudengoi]